MALLALIAHIASPAPCAARTLWVHNVVGNDSNTGLTFPKKTIQSAADAAIPGDTIYVAATGTDYDPFVVKCNNVTFAGFKNSAGDRDNGFGVPADFIEAATFTGSTELPRISKQVGTGIIGINVNGYSDVTIKNFYVTAVDFGVAVNRVGGRQSCGCHVENVYCWETG